MRKKYTKLYFERYASLTMAVYWQWPSSQFVQADRPDIHTLDETMGIEVTQALGLHEYGVDRKYLYADPSQMKKLAQRDFQEIAKAMARKWQKCQHYTSYDCNVLYIFTHYGGYEKAEVESFFQSQLQQCTFFDRYIINAITTLYVYDVQKKYLDCLVFSEKQLKSMHWEALAYERMHAVIGQTKMR